MVLKNACSKLLGLSQNKMDEPRGVSSRKVQQCLFQRSILDKYKYISPLSVCVIGYACCFFLKVSVKPNNQPLLFT